MDTTRVDLRPRGSADRRLGRYQPGIGKLKKLVGEDASGPGTTDNQQFNLFCVSNTCFVAGTLVHRPDDIVPIETLRAALDRVFTYAPHERNTTASPFTPSIESANYRLLRLVMHKPDGGRVDIEMLRSVDWLEDYGAAEGGSIWLDMPEMGACGQAEVLAIDQCPEIPEGPGRLVTATFRHTSGEVYNVKFEGESKPIGVTPTHPLWSVDRETWVSATDLEIGETLKTLAGTTVVESRSKREEPETVYNIEVEGDHVYRVGESGVLVHNASVPSRDDLISKAKAYREQNSMTNGAKNLGGIIYRKACNDEVLKFTARFPDSFVISDSTGHTEDQINQHLTSDPEIGNNPDSIDVLLLFTERTPCRRCSNTHIPDIERRNGGSIQDVLEWFVEHGTGSNRRLAIFYGFIEENE